MMILSIR